MLFTPLRPQAPAALPARVLIGRRTRAIRAWEAEHAAPRRPVMQCFTCFACGKPIDGPAVPRPQQGAAAPVLFHPACWESCHVCRQPVPVFEPAGASRGAAMPLLFKDSRMRARAWAGGVLVNVCVACAPHAPQSPGAVRN